MLSKWQMGKRLCYFFGHRNWVAIIGDYLKVLATTWLIVKVGDHFFAGAFWTGTLIRWITFGAPGLWAIYANFPRLSCAARSRDRSVEIEVKVGSILDERCHIVIGCNDCFDTELPRSQTDVAVINPKSIQGQFQLKYYKGREDALDGYIAQSLREMGAVSVLDDTKMYGKKERYTVGTCPAIRNSVDGRDQWVLLPAIAEMLSNERTAQADKDKFWYCLTSLWRATRERCGDSPVCVPVLGRGFGRLKPGSTRFLVELIIMSFVMETAQRRVSPKLTIVIYDNDYEPSDLAHLNGFLRSIDF